MRALVLEENSTFSYRETEMPVLGGDEVLVKVIAAGLCSSDIPRAFQHGAYKYPLILGHEVYGEIEGPRGKKERIVVYPLIACKRCKFCKDDSFNVCKKYDYIGSRRPGGFAEYLAVSRQNILNAPKLPDTIRFALAEPTAVLVHAAGKISDLARKKILIIGDGSMGLLLSRFLRYSGCDNVYLAGKYSYKLKIAKSFGAYVVKAPPQSFFDVVFELVGTNSAYESAIWAVKPRGEVCFIGNINEDFHLPKALFSQILRKEITIKGCWNSLPQDWASALQFLSAAPEAEKVISHIFPLSEGVKALESIYQKQLENYIKAIFYIA